MHALPVARLNVPIRDPHFFTLNEFGVIKQKPNNLCALALAHSAETETYVSRRPVPAIDTPFTLTDLHIAITATCFDGD